jgi:hypothetical protein
LLLDEEIEWIKIFETKEKGYNCTEGGKEVLSETRQRKNI